MGLNGGMFPADDLSNTVKGIDGPDFTVVQFVRFAHPAGNGDFVTVGDMQNESACNARQNPA